MQDHESCIFYFILIYIPYSCTEVIVVKEVITPFGR